MRPKIEGIQIIFMSQRALEASQTEAWHGVTYTCQESLAAALRVQTRSSSEDAVSVSDGYMIGMGSREDWRITSERNKYWSRLGAFYYQWKQRHGWKVEGVQSKKA